MTRLKAARSPPSPIGVDLGGTKMLAGAADRNGKDRAALGARALVTSVTTAHPERGSASAYDRYLAGMDATMRQKVALTAAHLLAQGEVADMGMGSGTGSHALAALYPELQVIGVDVDPTMVTLAKERYQLPNLRFQEGDIAKPCFPQGSVEAILDSSVLHHVTSFTAYDREAAARALAVQAGQLAPDGVLIVRDFLDPGSGECWLDLPETDFKGAADGDDPRTCSTAALFERFAREFRALLPAEGRGFPYRRLEGSREHPLAPGYRRYACAMTHAVEMVLRKDYREDWEKEVLEEYTYLTQEGFEATFARLGLRILASTPLRNPWIVHNRFRGRFVLRHPGGEPLDPPATNYIIAGQKVAPGAGVRLVEGPPLNPIGYLEESHWRHIDTGQVYDLVRRPGTTIDVLPWFEARDTLYVLARWAYPRPILACATGSEPLDGARPVTYVTEPANVQQRDKPLAQTVEEMLAQYGSLGADRLRRFEPGPRYFPSPGGLQEEVRAVHVEVEPVQVDAHRGPGWWFKAEQVLRAIEARQLLRSAQVGGLPDARLELNVYELLLRSGRDPGAWVGDALALPEGPLPDHTASLEELSRAPQRRCYRPAEASERSGFLELRCRRFDELDANGRMVSSLALEAVLPRSLSTNTVATALCCRSGGEVWLGIHDHDLPAAQCFDGRSNLLVAPAWRLPREVHGLDASRAWVAERIRTEHGLSPVAFHELGGRYHPSPGVTPEVVYPLAVVVSGPVGGGTSDIWWIPLREAVARRDLLLDGHLRIVAIRAAHALGLL
jgi:SAM-dependent methyltransferase